MFEYSNIRPTLTTTGKENKLSWRRKKQYLLAAHSSCCEYLLPVPEWAGGASSCCPGAKESRDSPLAAYTGSCRGIVLLLKKSLRILVIFFSNISFFSSIIFPRLY